ncbi:MAG: response regulator [Limisphaerales bacterium]
MEPIATQHNGSIIHVLLVEDNAAHSSLIEKYLGRCKRDRFICTLTPNLKTAVDILESRSFDVILLDLSLPDSHGKATFERVFGTFPGTPIIVLTAMEEERVGKELVQAGAQDFVSKVDLSEAILSHTIRYAIERSKFRSAIEARSVKLQELVLQLETFSYTVVHDLRAPLRSILGFADAIESEERLTATGLNYLERIKASAFRMDRLIQDVLSFARTAQTEPRLEIVDLESVIEDVWQDYLSGSNTDVRITVEKPLQKVSGNYALLVQCLSHLFNNALKFVGAGQKPVVRVWTEKSGSVVQIKVQDQGIGIPQELIGKVFEPFQRVHPQAQYSGSGIGLAITRKAVQNMGGQIRVESEVGRGSTFTIELKAEPTGGPDLGDPPGRRSLQAVAEISWPPAGQDAEFLILHVEDEETDALFFKRGLKKAGCRNPVHWVKDGLEAIEYLQESLGEGADRSAALPGLIILDLKMPRMNGFELLGWLNQKDEFRLVPRIVLTSSKLPQDVQRAYELGATSYLVKPSDPAALAGILKLVLDYWRTSLRPVGVTPVYKL